MEAHRIQIQIRTDGSNTREAQVVSSRKHISKAYAETIKKPISKDQRKSLKKKNITQLLNGEAGKQIMLMLCHLLEDADHQPNQEVFILGMLNKHTQN